MILPAEAVTELQQILAVSVVVAKGVSGDNVITNVSNEQVLIENDVTTSPISNEDVINAEFVNHSSQSGETMNDD